MLYIEPVPDGYIAAGYTEEPNKLEYIVKIGNHGEFIWDYRDRAGISS